MCPVSDGQAVNAANTNPAFLDAQSDDSAAGKIGFQNADVVSGSGIINTQRMQNNVANTIGLDTSANGTAEADTTGKTYGAPAETIDDGDSHKVALGKLAEKFDPATGHGHTGTDGDGAPINAATLESVPLAGYFNQGTDFTAAGADDDVSSLLVGKVPSAGVTSEGVVVTGAYNKVVIRNASGDAIEDGSGNAIYGRLTESSGVWTLTYYSLDSGVETAQSISSQTIQWYYQQLYNPMVNPPVYSPLASIPSDNPTQDVPDATTSAKGKVQLSSSAPPAISATAAAGTANATVANANHTHAGVGNLHKTGSGNTFQGDVKLTEGTGITITENTGLNEITIAAPLAAINQLTGDVTAGPGAGSQVSTISADVVDNTKLTNMVSQTIKGRTTAGTGDPEDLNATQATAILNNFVGDSGAGGTKGMVPAPAAGDAAAQKYLAADGTWQTVAAAGAVTSLTGDVTGSGPGATATTIANDAVTNVKAANMATQTIKGRATAGTGDPQDLTAAQATAILDAFVGDSGSGGTKGLVPAPAAGDTAADKFLKADGSWQEAGSGQGGINYITNGQAKVNTTGWALYADAAGAVPVDGTGGSPTGVTFNRNTTLPLRPPADFSFAKDAANRQGAGVSYDFTINKADQARVLSISFDYEVITGTFATGDITVWVYDVTNGVLCAQPAGNSIVYVIGPAQQLQCTFQTNSNSTSYRLIFHISSTSAIAYTLQMDTVIVGPQLIVNGSADTPWELYTPTFTGFGTVSTQQFYWRRSGSDIKIRGRFVAGTPTATEARVSFPFGLIANSNILTLENTGSALGWNGASNPSIYVLREPSVGYFTFANQAGGGGSLSKMNGSTYIAVGAILTIDASCPIAGWGAGSVLSSNANTRAIIARLSGDPASATSGNPIIFPSVAYDTAAAYNTATGRFAAPAPGFFKIYGSIDGAASIIYSIYVNGSLVVRAGESSVNGETFILASVQVNTGDLIDIRPNGTTDVLSGSSVTIEMLQSPQQIAASEIIAAQYTLPTTFAASATTPVNFSNKVIDTHNAVTVSPTAWRFTAPAPGIYSIGSWMPLVSSVYAMLHKNGTAYMQFQINQGTYLMGGMPILMQMNAGDYFDIRTTGASNVTGGAIGTAAIMAFVSVTRLGGVG